MKLNATYVFLILCASFLIYSFSIYLGPLSKKANPEFNSEEAARGRLIWQNHNCQSCHQLYGLGGYLGPDLTNVISDPRKGEVVIRALIKSGTKQMPAYDLSENEIHGLLEFLKSVDASGVADPRSFTNNNFGMIEKHENK